MTRLLALLGLVLLLAACEQGNPLDFDADRAPSVWVGSINGNDGRNAAGGVLYAPAGNMVDPATGQDYAYPVVVEVTASDERSIQSVELRVDGTTFDTLTSTDDAESFKNPFTFLVPFSGNASGLVETRLSVVARDSGGQVSDPHEQVVQVDGSYPRIDFTPPAGPISGQVLLAGSVSDPESGLLDFGIYVDLGGSPIASLLTTGSSFVVPFDSTGYADGEHFFSIVATNGANATIVKSFTFTIENETEDEAAP